MWYMPEGDTPVEALGISVGARNALKNGGIYSVEQLCEADDDWLLVNCPFLGPKRLEEVEKALFDRGLHLSF